MRRLSFLALTILASCTSVQVDLIDVSTSGGDYFFWLAVDENNVPRRTSAVYGIAGSQLRFGGDVLFPLQDGEARAVAVSFTRDDLTQVYSGFFVDREQELRALIGAPPTSLEPRGGVAITQLPSTISILGGSITGEQVRAAVHLELPIDLEHCRTSPDRLVPFTASVDAYPAMSVDLGRRIFRVRIIDRDRVLVSSEGVVYLARRGEAFSMDRIFTINEVPGGNMYITSIELGPENPGGPRAVFVGGSVMDLPAVLELALENDRLTYVRTATIPSGPRFMDGRVDDLELDDDGNLIAAGRPELLLVRERGSDVWHRRDPREAEGGSRYQRVQATHDPADPHLLSENRGFLFLGDAVTQRYAKLDASGTVESLSYDALAAKADGSELYAGGRFGVLIAKKRGEQWQTQTNLLLPPRFYPCALLEANGNVRIGRTIASLTTDEDALYFALNQCNSVLRMRTRDRCFSVLAPEEGVGVTESTLAAVDMKEGMLVAGGFDGVLLTIDL